MCQEVFEIVQTMDITQIETKMALQCAPTIVGIKCSNLLIVSNDSGAKVRMILKKTGIMHYCLLRQENKTIYLLFRKEDLNRYLQEKNVQQLLKVNGYDDLSLSGILREFRHRYETYMYKDGGFPHEIGILLGYPIEDVKGFIQHKGENYLYSGYWKVYEDVEEKKHLFDAYESAKEALILLVANGYELRSIIEFFQEKGFCFFLNT